MDKMDRQSHALQSLAAAIARWSMQVSPPLVVALDGHGASGKTTLVEALADLLPISVIHADDFFIGFDPARRSPAVMSGHPASSPELSTALDAPHVSDYYDFTRLREQALEPLLANCPTEFEADDHSRPGSRKHMVEVEPGEVIVVEGVGSAGAPLADLVQRRVLIAVSQAVRLQRLHAQIAPEDWDKQWLAAEFAYFEVDPPEFDLVIDGGGPGSRAAAGAAEPHPQPTD